MLKLSFKLNGRTIQANRIADELSKQVKKSATDMAAKHVQSIRCPIHHQTARISSAGLDGQFRVQGCCDQLIAEVRRQLR
jgi:hypothetical protein